VIRGCLFKVGRVEETDIQHIKSVLREWNKFPANAEADFECLVSEVVAALGEGFGAFDLAAVIHNEFMNHVGEPGPDDDVIRVAEELSLWWMNKSLQQ
jgi:hypothetical protein